MATQQTVWPCFPLTLPYQVILPATPLTANRYAGVVTLAPGHPCFYNQPRLVNKSPEASRRFFLDRAVFDLVDTHTCLSLNDPKLLDWFIGLSLEDRGIIQDEGGFHEFLRAHPALELSRHHVYVTYNLGRSSSVQASMTFLKHSTPAAQMSTFEMSSHLQELRHSPITQEPDHQRALSESFNGGPSGHVLASDPAVRANLSLDMELTKRCGKRGSPELRSHSSPLGQDAVHLSEVTGYRSEWAGTSLSEFFSFNSAATDGSKDADESHEESVKPEQVDCLLGPVEEEQQCCDIMSCGRDRAVDKVDARASLSDNFQSIMDEDTSILVCVDSAEKCTTPLPCVTTCDIMVGTDPTPCTSAFTQSEGPETANKQVLTKLHMSDLDYVAEEFIKMKTLHKEQKEIMKSLSGRLMMDCDCVQRAQQAELQLLALQYTMCRQHCWRLYHTSTEGLDNTHWSAEPSADILSVLQKLESDFNQMREKILEGVPLEQLQPLTVDSEKINPGASYIPALIIGDLLMKHPSWPRLRPQNNTSGGDNGCLSDQSSSGCQGSSQKSHTKETEAKEKISKVRRAVALNPKDGVTNHDATMLKETKKRAACEELNMNKAQCDPEDDLKPAVSAEMGHDPVIVTKHRTDESVREEAKTYVLSVTNLPSNVTLSDVMQWFEKYHASEINLSVLKNDLSVAMVTVSGLQSAEAAVREMNSFAVAGHTLHVEHINRPVDGSQDRSQNRSQDQSQNRSQSQDQSQNQDQSQDRSQNQDQSQDQSQNQDQSQASGSVGEPEQPHKVTSPPPQSSSSTRCREVVFTPTAGAGYIAQHCHSMGGFDTLLSELRRLHPHVGPQRVVDALVELRAQQQRDVLCSLPISTVREMMSELLTRPHTDTP